MTLIEYWTMTPSSYKEYKNTYNLTGRQISNIYCINCDKFFKSNKGSGFG